MIAFADETTAVDLVQNGWIVAHQLYQQWQVDELRHDVERVLHRRETRLACEIVVRVLLLAQMWRMIGADGVNQTFVQGAEQSLLVAMRLDGWIALDGEAFLLIIMVVKP